MKFSEFCQKNAVAVALLASTVALGFVAWNTMCPDKPTTYVSTGGHYGPRHRFFERYRMPHRSEEYKQKYRELANLLEEQTKLLDQAHKSGTVPVSEMMEAKQKFFQAKVALLRMESDARVSIGAIEAMAEIQFLKSLLATRELAYKAGTLPIAELNQVRIRLAEAELKLMEKERLLRRNQKFTELAASFNWETSDDETLKALIEAESTFPSRRPRQEENTPQQ